jgi:hypothetical protein
MYHLISSLWDFNNFEMNSKNQQDCFSSDLADLLRIIYPTCWSLLYIYHAVKIVMGQLRAYFSAPVTAPASLKRHLLLMPSRSSKFDFTFHESSLRTASIIHWDVVNTGIVGVNICPCSRYQ